jgi:hypothetical protein
LPDVLLRLFAVGSHGNDDAGDPWIWHRDWLSPEFNKWKLTSFFQRQDILHTDRIWTARKSVTTPLGKCSRSCSRRLPRRTASQCSLGTTPTARRHRLIPVQFSIFTPSARATLPHRRWPIVFWGAVYISATSASVTFNSSRFISCSTVYPA